MESGSPSSGDLTDGLEAPTADLARVCATVAGFNEGEAVATLELMEVVEVVVKKGTLCVGGDIAGLEDTDGGLANADMSTRALPPAVAGRRVVGVAEWDSAGEEAPY
jgi:hypothetical protein